MVCKFKDMESKKEEKKVWVYGGILVGTASWVSTRINVANIQKSLEREDDKSIKEKHVALFYTSKGWANRSYLCPNVVVKLEI